MAAKSPYVGMICQYNNNGAWQAAICVGVTNASTIDILHFTTVATSRTGVLYNESGATSTARPTVYSAWPIC